MKQGELQDLVEVDEMVRHGNPQSCREVDYIAKWAGRWLIVQQELKKQTQEVEVPQMRKRDIILNTRKHTLIMRMLKKE